MDTPSDISVLPKLKRSRTGLRKLVTLNVHRIQNFVQQDSAPEECDLEALSQRLHEIGIELLRIDSELEPLWSDDEYEAELVSSNEYREKLLWGQSKLRRWKNQDINTSQAATNNQCSSANQDSSTSQQTSTSNGVSENQSTITEQGPSNSSDTNSSQNSISVGGVNDSVPADATGFIRLPKFELEPFSGKVTDWCRFFEHFNSAVHRNTRLNPVDKLVYLRKFLTGTAFSTISQLPVQGASYEVALQQLQQRFGRPEVLRNEHLRQLRATRPVKNYEDDAGLRNLYDHLQTHVNGLTTLKVPVFCYEIDMYRHISTCLPRRILLDFLRQWKTNHPCSGNPEALHEEGQLTALLEFLRDEVEMREACEPELDQNSAVSKGFRHKHHTRENHQNSKRRNHSVNQVSASTFHTSTQIKNKIVCIFCQGEHYGKDCRSDVPASKRMEILKTTGRCTKCFRKGHFYKSCRDKLPQCTGCQGKHWVSVCLKTAKEGKSQEAVTKVADTDNQVKTTTLLTMTPSKKVIGLAFRAWVIGPRTKKLVRGTLDTASDRTFITKELSDMLSLPVLGEQQLCINKFSESEPTYHRTQVVQISLMSQYEQQRFIIEGTVVPFISREMHDVPDGELCARLTQAGMQLADVVKEKTEGTQHYDLLLGNDWMGKFLKKEILHITDRMYAISTVFGWSISGPEDSANATKSPGLISRSLKAQENQMKATSTVSLINTSDSRPVSCTTLVNVMHIQTNAITTTEDLRHEVQRFWDLEHLGIMDDNSTTKEEEVLSHFHQHIKWEDGRYKVALPWKINHPTLHDNYEVAKGRLDRLQRRLREKPKELQQYEEGIQTYLLQEHAEPVKVGSNSPENRTFYLPHQPVIREDKGTRLRIVFDGSSHAAQSISLNDALETGPNLNPPLLDILLRFRLFPVALTADIEKAFLQIKVQDDDKDALRFLWSADLGESVQVYRMNRVTFGLNCSPFLLAATIRHHLKIVQDQYPDTVAALTTGLYVDDLLTGAKDKHSALQLKEEAEAVMKLAGMKLRKWNSNDPQLQASFQEEPGTVTSNLLKVLGVLWRSDTDELTFQTSSLQEDKQESWTKREILREVATLFDPVGLISPFTVRAKILLQKLWKQELDWDIPVPDVILKEWRQWRNEIQLLSTITIPRYPFCNKGCSTWELHVFTDASEGAYAAVAYLVQKTKYETSSTLFVSKTRVAPVKTMTIPRLELMGTLIGARLSKYVLSTLSIPVVCFIWTDSLVALHWIQGSASRWQPFVANRVREIQQITNPQQWRHCPGTCNPADLASRGTNVVQLRDNPLWWSGPAWLKKPEGDWPMLSVDKTQVEQIEEVNKELRASELVLKIAVSATTASIDCTKYSSLNHLLRVTAWVIRFTNRCRKILTTGPLSADEILKAEQFCIREAQKSSYQTEFAQLQKNQQVDQHSKLFQFRPFLEDNIMRATTRLPKGELTKDQVTPIILDGKHHLTFLILQDAHQRQLHAGAAQIQAYVRNRFVIIGGRIAAKNVVKKCLICRRFTAKPIIQEIAPLPRDRVEAIRPFEKIGLDFAGPLKIKRRSHEAKAYIAIFTCSVTRAIHLELVQNLATTTFLMAIRRFIARRGVPMVIYSDNARTFKRASKDLQKIWNSIKDPDIKNFLANQKIKWNFITELAPWWGGFWERMVGSVKFVLRRTLGLSSLTFEELTTLLAEVEAVVNSRPLTALPDGPDEELALTPAHFLIGQATTTLPDIDKDVSSNVNIELSRRWRYRNQLSKRVWQRWQREYLLQLRSVQQAQPVEHQEVRKGTIVLVSDGKPQRLLWQTGCIEEVHTGRDGRVRSCTIRVVQPKPHSIKRPVNLLYPLEG